MGWGWGALTANECASGVGGGEAGEDREGVGGGDRDRSKQGNEPSFKLTPCYVYNSHKGERKKIGREDKKRR